MSDMVECRSGEVIAAEINGIKRQTEKTVRGIMLTGAMEIGCLLIEAKAVVPHGEWGAWLETNVDYSQTTANDLMRLYTEYKDGQVSLEGGPTNEELFGALAPSKALALLALPEQERREFVQTHDTEDMSVRQLRDEIAQIKAEKEAAEAAAEAADAELEAARAEADKANEAAAAAEEKRKEADAKRASAEVRRDEAVKAAVAAEREKLEKQLKKTRENLEKALQREKECDDQIAQLKIQLEEAQEKPEAEEADGESPEVAELKAQVERMEKALRAADPAFQKFGALLEQWQGTFYDLVGISYAEENTESGEKMRAILGRVLEGFAGEIKGDVDNG